MDLLNHTTTTSTSYDNSSLNLSMGDYDFYYMQYGMHYAYNSTTKTSEQDVIRGTSIVYRPPLVVDTEAATHLKIRYGDDEATYFFSGSGTLYGNKKIYRVSISTATISTNFTPFTRLYGIKL